MTLRRLAAVLAGAAACLVALATPAGANVQPAANAQLRANVRLAANVQPAALGNFSVSYNKSWTFKSKPEGVCVVFTASGSISYTLSERPILHGGIYEWTDIKVKSPKLAASVHTYGGGSCIGPATTSKLTMAQHWAGSSCSFNPSISVSLPWGVGVSAWPSCSDRNQARYSTTYNTRSASYTQNNTGSPITYGTATGATPSDYPCYGVYISAVAFEGSSSDSYGAGSGSSSKQVCLSNN